MLLARKTSKATDMLFSIIQRVLKIGAVQNFAKKKIDQKVTGPGEQTRKGMDTYVWAEVKNASGKTVTGRIKTPNGYTVTMDGILLTTEFFMEYQAEGGCFTPSQLMGAGLVERLPGAGEFELAG